VVCQRPEDRPAVGRALLRRLEDRLAVLANALEKAEVVSADAFLTTIEEMTMIEKYYTPEQLESLTKRREEIGEERIPEAPQRWADLGAAVQAQIDAGTDPSDPKVHELARQWFGLVNEFTGGDLSIFHSLRSMYLNEEGIQGMDVAATWRPMIEYIGKAAAAAGLKIPGQ
jgi:hypothetical protein